MVLANVCVMDPRSIIEGLSFLQLELSTDDITNPKPERVQMIYRVFCIAMLDVPETTLNHLPFDCEINPETAEMHHKSIPLALVFTIMKSFMADFADSQPDFTMCDMIAPNPKKTRKILSVLADYAIFHKPAYEIFLQTNSEYDEARKELDICNQEVNLCEERKRNLRSEEDSRKRRENALLAERNNRHAKFTQLMKDGEECDGRREAILRTIEKYKNDKNHKI
uniref:Nuf2 domain-containing protein n=1 Tax=Heterorhabditis bacteriophora TaxID=37862 RepID=A0A1I7XI28_HETBA